MATETRFPTEVWKLEQQGPLPYDRGGTVMVLLSFSRMSKHPAFQGRASWGKTFDDYPDKDENGHETHCAGTADSGPYRVAKDIAVGGMDDDSRGNIPDM